MGSGVQAMQNGKKTEKFTKSLNVIFEMIKVTNAPVFHHVTVYYVISRNGIYENQSNLVVLVSRSAYLQAKDLFAKLFIYYL